MATLTNLKPGDRLRLQGLSVNLATQGRSVVTASGTFDALVSVGTEVDPNAELGEDMREVLIIEARKDVVPDALLALRAESQVAATINGEAVTITKRVLDVTGPFVRFEAVHNG